MERGRGRASLGAEQRSESLWGGSLGWGERPLFLVLPPPFILHAGTSGARAPLRTPFRPPPPFPTSVRLPAVSCPRGLQKAWRRGRDLQEICPSEKQLVCWSLLMYVRSGLPFTSLCAFGKLKGSTDNYLPLPFHLFHLVPSLCLHTCLQLTPCSLNLLAT
ncbi:hypothetical protein DPEC_G00007610 [Dallia pectoralis]|uniref:Uncharacterized protein n=1 Tax=Dallia pectoralis TaxID=75939 RepID=A0ACC2HKX0_DALPE|nr:hypothetical protein DPEC_G00007610 [Dallia pectoralis]